MKASFDLHVLGTPPAFVLSQDQTLRRDLHRYRFPPQPSGEVETSFDRRAGACWSHDTDWRRHTVTLRTGMNPGGRPVCKFYELTAIAAWLGHGAIARTGFFVLSSVFKERRRQTPTYLSTVWRLKPLASAPGACSSFGPRALGGEGQRYPCRTEASTFFWKLFRNNQVHLAFSLADQEKPVET
jgi:hypothetical protein